MIAEDLDTDIYFLEEILEEKHCEVKHDKPSISHWCAPCTHQVTAILMHGCNGKMGYICQATVDSAMKLWNGNTRVVCTGCRRPVQECWTVSPK